MPYSLSGNLARFHLPSTKPVLMSAQCMQIPFSRYLHRFDGAFAEAAAGKPPRVVRQYRDDTVFTTWEVSFNALGPAAQELLLLFGFLDNESIPEELLPQERLNDGFEIGEPSLLFFHLVTRTSRFSSSRQYRLS